MAQLLGHEVHLLTIPSGEGDALVTMRLGGKHQQAALSTSIKLFALGLRQGCKAITQHDDSGQSHIEDCTHDALLTRRNSW